MNRKEHAEEGKTSVVVDAAAYSTSKGIITLKDPVTVEEPLEIRLCTEGGKECRAISVTMRTPGKDVQLAMGFLFTEGIIESSSDVISIGHPENGSPGSENVIEARLQDEVFRKASEYGRNFTANSGCGVCGKGSINEIFIRGRKIIRSGIEARASVILSLPQKMRESQSTFAKTGGIHAAALFDSKGELVSIEEDVGRHNALDKVIGGLLMRNMIPASDYIMQMSGRAGFEMVQKSIMAGVPIICSVSAPSSLAVETAEAFNATLVCFVRDGRFNVYSHMERIKAD